MFVMRLMCSDPCDWPSCMGVCEGGTLGIIMPSPAPHALLSIDALPNENLFATACLVTDCYDENESFISVNGSGGAEMAWMELLLAVGSSPMSIIPVICEIYL